MTTADMLDVKEVTRLEGEPDHIGVWPDRREPKNPKDP